jgi:spore maturation protein SpmB
MMVDVFNQDGLGPDSFAGRLASVFQGSTETTFYILSVYFGSVQIKKIRYAAGAGLFADIIGIIAAIFITFMFFTC